DALDLRPLRPETEELLQITLPARLLFRDRAVDDDLVPGDVLENALVGGRRAADVMLRLQPVDRDDNLQAIETVPFRGNLSDGARDHLGENAAPGHDWQQRVELAISHERLAADQRDMQRTMTVDQAKNAVDELLPLVVAD